jgi:hypothetical protein
MGKIPHHKNDFKLRQNSHVKAIIKQVPSSYIPPLEFPQSLDMRTMYNTWANIVSEAFRDPAKGEEKEKLDKRTFPWLPPEMCACEEAGCWLRKQETTLGACVHDVEILLRGVGEGYVFS